MKHWCRKPSWDEIILGFSVSPQPLNSNATKRAMPEYEGIKIELSSDVYPPEEDTLLFLEVLKKEGFGKEEQALEVGCGCGLLSLFLARRLAHVTGVDINEKAVELSKKNADSNGMKNVTFLISDMFSEVKDTFDVILFNPPYLPTTEPPQDAIDLSYQGGEGGRILTSRFLKAFPRYLKEGGRAYLLQSSVSGIGDTLEFLRVKRYTTRILAEKNVFFEKLLVMRMMV
jgi:release factor glutamine methyltransferase